MTLELIQDVSVTLAAVAAAVVIARRVMAIAAPSNQAGCSSCASPCATTAPTAHPSEPAPIQLLRRPPQASEPRR